MINGVPHIYDVLDPGLPLSDGLSEDVVWAELLLSPSRKSLKTLVQLLSVEGLDREGRFLDRQLC